MIYGGHFDTDTNDKKIMEFKVLLMRIIFGIGKIVIKYIRN